MQNPKSKEPQQQRQMPFLDKSKLIFHCISLRSDTKRRYELNKRAQEYQFKIQYHLVDRHPMAQWVCVWFVLHKHFGDFCLVRNHA